VADGEAAIASIGLNLVRLRSFALLLGLCACGGPAKREAVSLADAVDRYRRADGASRAAQMDAVAAVSCTDAGVCEAKRACLAAIEPTTRALALKDEVTLRLGDIEHKRVAPDSPEARALPEALEEAGRLLEEGRVKMADCERKLTDLHAHYNF
jgi:hypothetical protein